MNKRQMLVYFAVSLLAAGCASGMRGFVGSPVTAMPSSSPQALPAAGDAFVYRVINAYNGETRGTIEYRVDKIEPDRVFVAVNSTSTSEGLPRIEVYTPDGNRLRHPVVNHDQLVEYDFNPPYPAYVFPLTIGKSWSVRVNGVSPVTGRRASVRVDAWVQSVERITTEAGAFDTFRIRRQVYAGDWESFLRETNITEIEWYAPELGRAVRAERNSTWTDTSRLIESQLFGGGYLQMRGDWSIYELVSMKRSGQPPR